MAEEWSDWIEHGHKRHCGESLGVHIQCLCLNGRQGAWYTEGAVNQIDDWSNVRRYRVRKPRALQQLRDMIADIPVTVKEDA